jgi:pimeloyl-ACP methyl ester carboxylesterase
MSTIAVLVVVLIAAGALYQVIGEKRCASMHPPPGATIDVDGQRLHAVCAGRGQPDVLFESGIAASSLSWSRVLPEVAAFTRACAYDRAGLGWSAPARRPRTVALMLQELRGVMEISAPVGPHVLVGHSFGAFLTSAYAAQHAADIAGLVLLDPPSEWHDMTRQQRRMLRGGRQLARVGEMLARVGIVRACLALLTGGAPGVPRNVARVFGPTVARTLERLVGEVRKLPPEVHPIVQTLWCQPKCFRAMADHFDALPEMAACAAGVRTLGDIPLVVVSSGDQPPEIVARHRALAGLSSNGRHVVASRSGHWIQFDEPDLVVSTVRDLVGAWRRSV